MVEAKIDTDKKIFFILILALIVFGIGRAYAYFSAQSDTNEQSVTTGTLKLDVQDDGIIRAQNIFPIDNNDIFDKATKLNFTIKNTGTIDLNAKVKLNILSITDALKSNDFKWTLYNGQTKINDGTFLNAENNIEIVNNISISTNNSENYDLYIWIEETNIPQDALQKGTLNARIVVEAVQ